MTNQVDELQPVNKSNEKPLAFTKRGKILAVLGGIPCGPLGIIVAPIALCLINLATRKGEEGTNRFLIWSFIGIPAFMMLWFIQFFVLFVIGAALCGDDPSCMDLHGDSPITDQRSQ